MRRSRTRSGSTRTRPGPSSGPRAPFDWLQSSVLSVRYADGSLATYITVARFVDNSLRVIADETFPSGDEVLCAGRDVQQF